MIQNKSWVRRALGLCKLARQRHRSVQAASQTAGGPTQTPSHDTAEQIGYRGKPIMCTCDSWSLAARLLSLWASWCANRRMVRALCGCGRPPAFPRRLLERLLRAWAWVSLSFLWILFTVSLSSDRKKPSSWATFYGEPSTAVYAKTDKFFRKILASRRDPRIQEGLLLEKEKGLFQENPPWL